jgi:hypothetical protein
MFRVFHPPMFVGGLAMLWGYVKSALTGAPRYEDLEFRRFLRAYQRDCLLRGKGPATEALNSRQAPRWSAQNPVVA